MNLLLRKTYMKDMLVNVYDEFLRHLQIILLNINVNLLLILNWG